MPGGGEGQAPERKIEAASRVHGVSLNPEGPEVVGDLETRYHSGTHPFGDGLGVADMITMSVG